MQDFLQKLKALQTRFRVLPDIDWANKMHYLPVAFISLGIILSTYFLASLTALVINPYIPEPPVRPVAQEPEIVKDTIERYDSIINRNLFNEKGLMPETGNIADSESPAVKSHLPLDLLGTIVVKDKLKSVASVQDRSAQKVIAVKINDKITSQTTVKNIEADKLYFFNSSSGRNEFIELPQEVQNLKTHASGGSVSIGKGISKSGDNNYTIERSELEHVLGEDLNTVLTQARCIPNFEDGKAMGFRCFQIVPGSIYDKLGIKNDDVIISINGQAMNDPSVAFNFFTQLRNMSNIEIGVKRGRQITYYNYTVQ